ncbi:hypothetical protein BASA60_007705 [Batrachochytrium salamandrivorans]|nr:hypothetical protein BASA60_007705 [Batrachochytrium salamandrivorans]
MISLPSLFILLLTAGVIHAQAEFMFDPLLWVLPHFITHYAGKTTQGNRNDGDDVDLVSGSNPNPKDATSLPQRFPPYKAAQVPTGK